MLDSAVVFTLIPWHPDRTIVATTTRNIFCMSFPFFGDAPVVAVPDL